MEIQQVDILLRLIIAHLLADFVFQTDQIAKEKKRGLRSGYFYVHLLIVCLLTYLFLGEWSNWQAPLIIMLFHGLIDLLKIRIRSEASWVFLGDQLLHILTVILLWIYLTNYSFSSFWMFLKEVWQNEEALIVLTAYLLISIPTSVLIGSLTRHWQNLIESDGKDSLKDAGKWIGIIERSLILTFILVNQWAAIGFLLTAKSVFRFGDLKEGAERKKTEYILIGTLLSFTFSIFTGIATRFLCGIAG